MPFKLLSKTKYLTGLQLKQFAEELYNLYPLENIYPEQFVDMLLRCGVIGEVVDPVPSDSEREIYCIGRFEYMMQGNLALTDRLKYCIHPVMADVFRMAAPEDRGVVYPMPEEDVNMCRS